MRLAQCCSATCGLAAARHARHISSCFRLSYKNTRSTISGGISKASTQKRRKDERPIMSTLTYSRSHLADAASTAGKPERKGFWRRVYEALVASQQRRADREIAAYIARHGGLLTDDMERQIMQRIAGDRRRSV